MTHRRVRRWEVGLVATLALTGFGLLFANRTLLVSAVIPLSYVLYGAVSRVPSTIDIAVERSFDQPDPRPGDTVAVTLTVENTGRNVLTDLRIVDGVPEEFAVTDGSPRACVAIPPGDAVTLTYSVVAKRGQYDFADPVVCLRSLSATEQRTETVAADGDVTLSCANTVQDVPLRDSSLPRAGTLPTDTGGSGLEFYATRQYQPGDPMSRVDWRHYAKTGEFVTVQYRQEQSIRTVIVVDARPVGRVTAQRGYPTGAELCAYAGERLYDALDGVGISTTVTAVGIEEGQLDGLVGPDGLPWVDTDSGQSGLARRLFHGLQTIADDDAQTDTLADLLERRQSSTTLGTGNRQDGDRQQPPGDGEPATVVADGGPDDDKRIRRLLARLPPNAQVVVCTPLVDDWPTNLVRSLTVRGYPQVVVSPDVTSGETVGQRVLGLSRHQRIEQLERAGATTVSWDLDQPIDYALRLSLPHLLSQR